MPLSGLVAAGIGAAVSAGNIFSQQSANRQNVQFQREQNALNRKWALEQWNRENRYNSPAAQMQRLKAAGLNPGLIYGDGAAGMPAAASHSPEQTAPQVRPVQIDPLTFANIDLASSQAEKNRADAEEAKSRIPVHRQQIINMQQEIDESLQRITESMQRVDESGKRIEGIDLDNLIKSVDYAFREERNRAELESIYAGIERLGVQNWKDYQDVENALKALAIQSFEAQTNRINSGVNAYNAATQRQLALSQMGLNEQQYREYCVQWEALGVHFRPDGSVVLDEKGALATQKGERSRHTLLYQYISDYFGVIGKILNGNASVSKVLKK